MVRNSHQIKQRLLERGAAKLGCNLGTANKATCQQLCCADPASQNMGLHIRICPICSCAVSDYVSLRHECICSHGYLGPDLFKVFTDDLDGDIKCSLSKFDDGKLGGSVNLLKGKKTLQGDLDRLNQWAKGKYMRFQRVKCCILHLSCSNSMQCYGLRGRDLRAVQ